MDFSLSEEQEEIRRAVRRVCAGFDAAYWRKCDAEKVFPWDFYRAMAEGGWLGIAIPEPYGGAGCGITEASIVLEEVAASGGALNASSALHLSIFGMNPVVKHGSAAMRERYLPKVARGELHVAFGVTEPNAGSDTAATTTRAWREGDHYVVRGEKVWTTKALDCEKVLLLVRTTPIEECRRRTDGLTLLLADLQRPEVEIVPIDKLGRNAVASCIVRYDDLRVELADRVGEEGQGFSYLLDGLNPERILIAAEALGIGRAALAAAVEYASSRVVFSRPIGKNQGIAFPLAEAHMRLRAAELVVREASWRYDAGLDAGEAANSAKYLAAQAGFFAADRAMQTHGGYGYASEYNVARYFVESRLLEIVPISQEMVLNYVAQHVLHLPRSY